MGKAHTQLSAANAVTWGERSAGAYHKIGDRAVCDLPMRRPVSAFSTAPSSASW